MPGEAADEFGWLIAGLTDTSFALGILFRAMVDGASKDEIDKLERGLIYANARRWWYKEGVGK